MQTQQETRVYNFFKAKKAFIIKLPYRSLPDFLILELTKPTTIFLEVKQRNIFNLKAFQRSQPLQAETLKKLNSYLLFTSPSSKKSLLYSASYTGFKLIKTVKHERTNLNFLLERLNLYENT